MGSLFYHVSWGSVFRGSVSSLFYIHLNSSCLGLLLKFVNMEGPGDRAEWEEHEKMLLEPTLTSIWASFTEHSQMNCSLGWKWTVNLAATKEHLWASDYHLMFYTLNVWTLNISNSKSKYFTNTWNTGCLVTGQSTSLSRSIFNYISNLCISRNSTAPTQSKPHCHSPRGQ